MLLKQRGAQFGAVLLAGLVLNVGPTALGEFPQPIIERLDQIGAWMKVNGEAIYGTTASPFEHLPWGRCTVKMGDYDATLYLHVFDWPKDGRLVVPALENEVVSTKLLATGVELKTETDKTGIVVMVPTNAPDPIASVVALTVHGAVTIKK